MSKRPRVALIHAVTVAMAPVERAFADTWPEADRINLLDDSLSPDRELTTGQDPAVLRRIETLASYAEATGARGILFTCSAFGEAIEMAARRRSLPVLKPNEAMFERALSLGERIGMIATFPPSIDSMEREFEEMVTLRGSKARLETVLAEGALVALKAGDRGAHDRLVAEAVPKLAGCDAILLAHFSTSNARDAVMAVTSQPVLTSPHSAVLRLKELMDGDSAAS